MSEEKEVKKKEKEESFAEYMAKIISSGAVLSLLNEIIINTTPYRPKSQIKQKLNELRKKLTCNICGYKGIAKPDYDGLMQCPKCKEYVKGNWIDYGEFKALKWVLAYKPKSKKKTSQKEGVK
jgi:ribosomal protein L37AE/L43A